MTNLEKLDTLPALRAELERTRYERDSLRLELDGLEQIRLRDNQYLIDQRDAERARAEQAERDRDTWRQACAQVEARAEQAERERVETLRMWREYKAAKDADVASTDAARERAEADNAVLMRQLRDASDALEDAALPGRADDLRDAFEVNHPGAALLERVRALETAATTAAAELRHAYPPETRDWNLVARAITVLEKVTTPNADALKERKP